ncbi:MAG TPA: hypothetical protein VJC03_00930, partial [bacterium]|nr:hypothetical protein [bacterium]
GGIFFSIKSRIPDPVFAAAAGDEFNKLKGHDLEFMPARTIYDGSEKYDEPEMFSPSADPVFAYFGKLVMEETSQFESAPGDGILKLLDRKIIFGEDRKNYFREISAFYPPAPAVIRTGRWTVLHKPGARLYLDEETKKVVGLVADGEEAAFLPGGIFGNVYRGEKLIAEKMSVIEEKKSFSLKFESAPLINTMVFPFEGKLLKIFWKIEEGSQLRDFMWEISVPAEASGLTVNSGEALWRGPFPEYRYARNFIKVSEIFVEERDKPLINVAFSRIFPGAVIFVEKEPRSLGVLYQSFSSTGAVLWEASLERHTVPQDLPVRPLTQEFAVKIDGRPDDPFWQDAGHLIDPRRDASSGDVTDIYFKKEGTFLYFFIEGAQLTELLLAFPGEHLCSLWKGIEEEFFSRFCYFSLSGPPL